MSTPYSIDSVLECATNLTLNQYALKDDRIDEIYLQEDDEPVGIKFFNLLVFLISGVTKLYSNWFKMTSACLVLSKQLLSMKHMIKW